MLCYENAFEPTVRLRDHFVSLATYKDGDGGGGRSDCGSDFDDDSNSWLGNSVSGDDATRTSGSSSSSSSSRSSSSSSSSGDDDHDDDDGDRAKADDATDSESSFATSKDVSGGGNKSKWLKALWIKIDFLDDDKRRRTGHGGIGDAGDKRSVKTILRPPTMYKYVIGMSGFPSKVPVYPRRM